VNVQVKRPARVPRSRRRQDKNPKAQTVSFGAYPEEIERWKSKAKDAQRTMSWWIRSRLLAMDAIDENGRHAEVQEAVQEKA